MSDKQVFVLALDQGTTSSRALLFDLDGAIRAVSQRELPQIFPAPGLVEHDAERIWRDTLETAREVVAEVGVDAIDGIGITNQRETTVLWDRAGGEVLHHAIVWQDRRTAGRCRELAEAGHGPMVTARTGLLLDPYFSATKIAWLLDNVEGARARAEAGELAFGTIDCFLLWRLTGGRVHATDPGNAARTQLFDIHRQVWDEELLNLHGIPKSLMPEVRDSSGDFGESAPEHFGRALAINGIAGDQQAATFGQAAFAPGAVKCTYGTGCFALQNTGREALPSSNQLLTTVAWRLAGEVTYALEGSIFIAGAAVQWLRDGLRFFDEAGDSEALAAEAGERSGVYLVPAFTGLGAPYWDADARGALFGLTRDTGIAEITRATLESVCFQTRDLLEAMAADGAPPPPVLRVDGGMTHNNWTMQFLADVLGTPVERPAITETTALGAACLAGLASGFFDGPDHVASIWRLDRRFEPAMSRDEADTLYAGWLDAVERTRSRTK